MSLRKATTGVVGLFAGVFIALMSGCGSGSNTSLGPGGNTTSQLRSYNALVCSTYNSLDFAQRVSTALLTQGAVYGQINGYNTVPAGNGINDFAIQTGTVVAQKSFDLHPDGSYTLAAAGDCSQASASGVTPTLFQFTDTPPTTAQLSASAALRIIHLAPATAAGYQTIDVYNAGLPLSGLTNIGYGTASVYALLPAATYNLSLHSHATNALLPVPAATTNLLASLNLAAGHVYTLFVIGTTNNVPNEAFDVKWVQDK